MDFVINYCDEKTNREFEIVADVCFYKERYGADADGNRGEMRYYSDVEDYSVFEEVRTMPLWLFSIRHFFNKKIKAWKEVERKQGELPTDLEERIDCYVQEYEYEETESPDYSDPDDDGDRRYDEMVDEGRI